VTVKRLRRASRTDNDSVMVFAFLMIIISLGLTGCWLCGTVLPLEAAVDRLVAELASGASLPSGLRSPFLGIWLTLIACLAGDGLAAQIRESLLVRWPIFVQRPVVNAKPLIRAASIFILLVSVNQLVSDLLDPDLGGALTMIVTYLCLPLGIQANILILRFVLFNMPEVPRWPSNTPKAGIPDMAAAHAKIPATPRSQGASNGN